MPFLNHNSPFHHSRQQHKPVLNQSMVGSTSLFTSPNHHRFKSAHTNKPSHNHGLTQTQTHHAQNPDQNTTGRGEERKKKKKEGNTARCTAQPSSPPPSRYGADDPICRAALQFKSGHAAPRSISPPLPRRWNKKKMKDGWKRAGGWAVEGRRKKNKNRRKNRCWL